MDFRYAGGEGKDDTIVSQQSRGRVEMEHPPAAIVEAERAANSTDYDESVEGPPLEKRSCDIVAPLVTMARPRE